MVCNLRLMKFGGQYWTMRQRTKGVIAVTPIPLHFENHGTGLTQLVAIQTESELVRIAVHFLSWDNKRRTRTACVELFCGKSATRLPYDN